MNLANLENCDKTKIQFFVFLIVIVTMNFGGKSVIGNLDLNTELMGQLNLQIDVVSEKIFKTEKW